MEGIIKMVILVQTYRLEYGWLGGTGYRSNKVPFLSNNYCAVIIYYEGELLWLY
jgi:hypothetical protein